MANAFGAKRPKTGRGVDDIKRMTPEEWRELQDEILRDYTKKFVGLADVAAKARQFQRDAQAAAQRQATPLPFGGGMPTLDFEMRSPARQTGLPFGVQPPNVPRSLPLSGNVDIALGRQTGTPGVGYGTGVGAPGSPGAEPGTRENPNAIDEVVSTAQAPQGTDMSIAALALAGLSDAVKENLTLQGARGAKGAAAEKILALEEQRGRRAREERAARTDDMRFRLELSKWLSEQPERQLKSLTTFADLAAKVGDLAATASPEQAKVMQSGLEQEAARLGLPTSWVGDYMAQGQTALASIRGLLPHIDPAALQLIMMQSKALLKEGKFLERAQEAANFGIRTRLEQRWPNVLASLDKQATYQGKDKPFDLVVDLIAGEDQAIRDYLMGATAPKDEHARLMKRFAASGIAVPEDVAAIKKDVAGARAMLPVEVEKAEALEQIKQKYAGVAQGRTTAKEIRNDFLGLPLVKTMQQAIGSLGQMEQVYAGPHTTAADWSLIVGYAKINDPDSVAREGEQAAVRGLAAIDERIANAYDLFLKKKLLPIETRAAIMDAARRLVQSRVSSHLDIEREFKAIARRQGADPLDAVPDILGAFRSGTKKTATKPEPLSRKSETYKQARSKGFTDEQIEREFNIKLTD